ncbi:MAG: hypothetical protein UW30_C0024G0010 [Candidatus Giovannonibacteria bacterium GW2011_GWA2_44_13b]|uniref:Uncharacterized protein n=2 Tax=Candidatus Giovannoniibacteriota TaxID=1752738 RepID=A0A0G1J811_9BACT|nr:MAG: hypothetical protein UW30_C0024G0010 [Candidatus Giovannonibacteria bacterium GW2011_GWA2_44_13b]OGF82542.1 MAG: hypothetical protein A2924_02070 [Candidatus Giovannonibacteria bacterium RIFCSPLOWO2_01_FULL_44_16]
MEKPVFCIPPDVEVTIAVIRLVTEEPWVTCLSPSLESVKEKAETLPAGRLVNNATKKKATKIAAKRSFAPWFLIIIRTF